MTPLQDLRIWLREASVPERITTLVASVIAVALFGWLVAPAGGSSNADGLQSVDAGTGSTTGFGETSGTTGASSGTTGGGAGSTTSTSAGTGATGLTGTTGVVTTGTSGTTGSGAGTTSTTGAGTGTAGTGTGTASGTTGPSTGKACPRGADQGVTATRVDVAVTLINITGAAGNAVFSVPSTSEQQKDWTLLANTINASGGFGCRKVALRFWTINPLDANDAQNQCLRMAASKPFLTLDTGALTNIGASDCLPGNKVPLVSQYITGDQAKKYFPYYLSPAGLQEIGYRSNYLGAKAKGFFAAANGFKKLGIIYQNCRPSIVTAGRAAIRAAGVPDSAVVTYNFNCPPGRQTNAADQQQAVLTFKREGVTHLTALDVNDFPSFTRVAAQQSFKPKYLLAEDDKAIQQTGAFAPNAGNLDGAINVNGGRYGEQTTTGFKPSSGTARCNALFAKNGQPPVYEQGAGYGGVVCTYMWFVKALLDHAPQLTRTALVSGMRSIGPLEGSYPFGPVDFGAVGPNTPYGLESWRLANFVGSCSCWRIPSPVFNKAFP